MKLICCTALVVFASALAFSQTPKSGALLTINGTVGSTAVLRKIYDSQIHNGTVRNVPTTVQDANSSCGTADQIPTDAYVLQGGSPSGCDPGDPFETSQAVGSATIAGSGYSFAITTFYTFGPQCNSNMTICVGTTTPPATGPDTGFLTITNNSGAAFTGTITLSGNSQIPGGAYCPATGTASDSVSGLANGSSWTFALSNDSSNCGGFNAPQILSLSNTSSSTALFGNDDYQITPFNAAAGDKLSVLPVPVPTGMFSATNFPSQQLIPIADFSASGNPVGIELQTACSPCSDSGNFFYTAQVDYTIDANSRPNGIGGPAFLGQHGVNAPTSGFDFNIFLSYTAAPVDPTKGSGGGTGTVFAPTFDPTATNITTGTVGFVGFQSPVVDTAINVVKAGSGVPLKWTQTNSDGSAETNLSWCQTGPTTPGGSVCADVSPLPTVSAPWVFLGTIAIACPNDTLNTATDTLSTVASGKSGFQANFPSAGSYQFNWQTVKGSTGCVVFVLQYDTGLQVFQAIFKYSKT